MHWGIKGWFWVEFRCYSLRSDLGFICRMFGSFLAFNENLLLIWMVTFSISASYLKLKNIPGFQILAGFASGPRLPKILSLQTGFLGFRISKSITSPNI